MFKKFSSLGDSSSNSLTDGTVNPNTRNRVDKEEFPTSKIRVVKTQPRFDKVTKELTLERVPQCSFYWDNESHVKTSQSTSEDSKPSSRLLWSRFKSWFRGLCICGRERKSCNGKLASWRSFRKDCMGGTPVAMTTSDASRINYMHSRTSETDVLPQDSLPPPPYEVPSDNYRGDLYNDVGMSERLFGGSSVCSMETGGSRMDFDDGRQTPWCKILYWEGNERRGNIYNVQDEAVNVLGDTPHGSGLSLAAFFANPPRDERIKKTRRKICQGLVLWREDKVIWVYNRSEAPVYLNSASLDGSFFDLNLYKCPPGYAMIIYYYEMAHALMGLPDYKDKCMTDKADVNSVRISFAKGWGKNYHRREILCCPCWIEVHVVPTLRVEQLTPPR